MGNCASKLPVDQAQAVDAGASAPEARQPSPAPDPNMVAAVHIDPAALASSGGLKDPLPLPSVALRNIPIRDASSAAAAAAAQTESKSGSSSPIPQIRGLGVPVRGGTEESEVHKTFRRSVAKIVNTRRMWDTMWKELDRHEETMLRAKYDVKMKLLSAVSAEPADGKDNLAIEDVALEVAESKSPLPPSLARQGSGDPDPVRIAAAEREFASADSAFPASPRSMTRALASSAGTAISDADVYTDMGIPSASAPHGRPSPQFLGEMTRAQHRSRCCIGPWDLQRKSTKYKDYDVADLPELDDDAPLTPEFLYKMVQEFKKERILSYKNAFQLARRACRAMVMLPNVPELVIPKGSNIAVIGDLHGQLDDLLMIFREAGTPGPAQGTSAAAATAAAAADDTMPAPTGQRMLFNGDFVDRGHYSCEVLLTLLACKALYPEFVFLNRGNHECADMNSVDGFQKEVEAKYDTPLYHLFNYVFATLPTAHLILAGQQRVFVVHAGLSYRDVTIAQVNTEDRYKIVYPMRSLLQDMLWSDPFEGVGHRQSKRGAGCQFGSDVAGRFLINNNVNLIIRSHECEDNGFALWFENRLYTIFSASDYCGDSDNYGAFCLISDAPAPQIRVYMAKKQVLRYQERMSRYRKSIISKLLVRIVSNIQRIEIQLLQKAQDRGTPDIVSRVVWADTLRECLAMDAPFIQLGEYLGADITKANSVVEVTEWCKRFKPKYHPETDGENDLKRHLSDLLYDPHSPFIEGLEALFTHFDANSDGSITYDEFTRGVHSLMEYLGKDYKDSDMAKLLEQIDKNHDGEIDYNEFFAAFAYGEVDVDVKL